MHILMGMKTPFLIGSTIITGLLLAGCVPQNPPPAGSSSTSSSAASAVGIAMSQPEHILAMASEITWKDAPAILPAGAKIAVLEGDPSKSGPFTLRLQFPADYRIAPHRHPADEHVTVIEGDLSLGMGETFEEAKLKDLGQGGFAMMRTGTPHFAWSKDGATVQLHGIGPWGLTYVNPADDPSKMVK